MSNGWGETSLDKSAASSEQLRIDPADSICQIAGASFKPPSMISGFYPRHEPFIDSRQSQARAAALSSSAPLNPPHAHNGVELVGTLELGGKSLRNFLWAKHRAVSWLRQPVAGDRMGFATSVTDGGNDGMLGEQGRIPAGTESLEECIAARARAACLLCSVARCPRTEADAHKEVLLS